MKLKEGEKPDASAEAKVDSINNTIHKIRVITPFSFSIGDTRKYEDYTGNGIGKQLRTKSTLKMASFKDTMIGKVKQDDNLCYSYFEKFGINDLAHIAFEALDKFKSEAKRMPKPWDLTDATAFVDHSKKISEAYDLENKPADWTKDGRELNFFY